MNGLGKLLAIAVAWMSVGSLAQAATTPTFPTGITSIATGVTWVSGNSNTAEFSGTLTTAVTENWYTFSLSAITGDNYVTLTSTPDNRFSELTVSLFSSTGTLLDTATTNSSGFTYLSDTWSNLSNGTYYFAVSGLPSGDSESSYSGQLSINPVPLPGAMFLFGSGLLGMAAVGYRRRRASPRA